ncbi:hypothetical protein M422DRAFT_243812 [Sphaerobolus stellatus SS14]|nr:hypothetical protein M422DRAFT_243812 [Sphaerobolus stellatus SS14]
MPQSKVLTYSKGIVISHIHDLYRKMEEGPSEQLEPVVKFVKKRAFGLRQLGITHLYMSGGIYSNSKVPVNHFTIHALTEHQSSSNIWKVKRTIHVYEKGTGTVKQPNKHLKKRGLELFE